MTRNLLGLSGRQSGFLFGALTAVFLLPHADAAAPPQVRPSLQRQRTGGEISPWPSSWEKGSYRAFIPTTGELLWEVDWETTAEGEPDRRTIKINEKGRGRPLRYKELVIWEKQMVFQLAPHMQLFSVEGSRWRSSDGARISWMAIRVDPKSDKLSYRESEEGETKEEVTLAYSPGVLPDELLFHWIRLLPFSSGSSGTAPSDFLLLISPSRRIRIRASIRGREVVATPAGTFLCYQVELSPRLGPLSATPLKALVPKMMLWCASEPPHFWVRYRGPVGGPGSPQAVIELVKFQRGPEG